MKTSLFLCSVLFLLSSVSPARAGDKTPRPGDKDGEWTLVWSDEFNTPGAPSPKKWTYEEGLVRNREEQYYTKNKRQNARVENGCLVIEARREPVKNPKYDKNAPEKNWQKSTKAMEYTSASLTTEGRASWQYGKVEVRAKLPKGQGSWPAIWMMGDNRSRVNWPLCGEIDIMEHVTSSPGTIYGTSHWKGADGETAHKKKGFTIKGENLTEDFHVYGIEWDKDSLTYFLDGKPYGTFHLSEADDAKGENSFRKPFYLLINLALGGQWGGAVQKDKDPFPRQYLIDYVRVYQKNPGQ